MKEFLRKTTGKIADEALPKPNSQALTSSFSDNGNRLVSDLFADQVRATPDSIALIHEGNSVTYRQLDERSNQLANYLKKQGVKQQTLVPICISRSLEMIVGVLAIFKTGGVYVPIEPDYPQERIQYILSDVGGKVVVTDSRSSRVLTGQDAGLDLICVDRDWEAISNESKQFMPVSMAPHNLAYILFTSGSTGKPKGVCMGHGPLVNLLLWQAHHSRAGRDTRTLQLAPLSFDVSFQEIMATLTTGGTLMLINEELRLDMSNLLAFIDKQVVNRLFLPFVALQYLAETAVSTTLFPASLHEVMTAGEQLKITPQVAAFFSALPNCVLYNQYGPTECHVVSELKLDGNPADWPQLPSIGKAIDNVDLFIINEQMQVIDNHEPGELCISGRCLAQGYLNQPALTDKKFINLETPQYGLVHCYRTDDLARFLPDGTIEFLGRRDDQVKIRGHRVELGEIEVVISQMPAVQQAVVVARESADGQKQLVAYLISSTGLTDSSTVRKELRQRLPEYMMPSAFVWMDDLPRTSSGKVDRKKLPSPERNRSDWAELYRQPVTELEQTVADLWASLLQIDKVGVDDNFFDLGGNSLLAQRTVIALKQKQYVLPVTKLYQYPTPGGIAQYLQPVKRTVPSAVPEFDTTGDSTRAGEVAVIGMSGRFPGANTIDELWDVLREGRETTQFFSYNELDGSIPTHLKNDPLYVRARGVLEQADCFDASFFGLPPTTVQLMDPQQRIFLEVAWETLEQTGHLPQHYAGRVGVFAGCGNNTYFLNNVLGHKDLMDQVGPFQVMTINEKDYIASRTAYQLNLKGPAVSVHSACSTSLLAITQAVQSLRNGQCEVALAGGASITTPINSGHLYQEGSMMSSDGHCRSFDARGNGTVFSDGVGVVLLKSLDAAQRDGDTVYAVIKGIGVNNDGGGKGSFTAPSAEGQAGAIKMALNDARVDPSTISYVEAHGTATPIGDPIEIDGLKMAFGHQPLLQYCAIGSIKSNMGHLTAAAGVAGFIKTTLALYHKQLPASLGFSTPNPNIDFAGSPFFVNTHLTDWKTATQGDTMLRRAGVSSFGVGGTNVHVVLEEYAHEVPAPPTVQPSKKQRSVQLISWSAKSTASCDAYANRLAVHLQKNRQVKLGDVAFTLHTTRVNFNHRQFVVAATGDELVSTLLNAALASSSAKTVKETPGEIVFLFPGQGSQYLNMGRELYENEPVYKQAIDECAELLRAHLDTDIRQIMYPNELSRGAEEHLKNTLYTQSALFVTEYALARLWMSWGIEPSVFCGHSVGEFVAAHLAGVFSLADVLTVIAMRGRLVSELPRGSMLSVRMEADKISVLMPEPLSISAINSDKLCVVAGHDEDIAAFASVLDGKGIPNRVLHTSHAFHSAMMDSVVPDLQKVVEGIALNCPQKPIMSTVSGDWLTDAEATDPHYWAKHLRLTVCFADALESIFKLQQPLFLEVGPGNVTATFARQQAGSRTFRIVTSLDGKGKLTDYQSTIKTLGQLWQSGLEPNWNAFYGDQDRTRIDLPTYAFDKKRYWVDPVASTTPVTSLPVTTPAVQEPHDDQSTEIHPYAINMRKDVLLLKVKEMLEEASGLEMEDATPDMSFLEIGFDSLLLTQVSILLKREFNLPITFRQLNEEYATLDRLVSYLDTSLPAGVYDPQAQAVSAVPSPAPVTSFVAQSPPQTEISSNSVLDLMAQQLQILSKQMALMQGGNQLMPGMAAPAPVSAKAIPVKTSDLSPEEEIEIKKPFGASARIERQATELTPQQNAFLQQLIDRYNMKTGASKAYTQEHRDYMADPRVVSGFKPLTKELVYPIVVNKSQGSRLWDIDGNEYIDMLNGFGSNMFGYQPDFIKDALFTQIESGFEVGPQHELAGEVSRMICDFTGFDRAALCSTGSEAVLGVMRIARTVTGRSLIVAFSGSYHGIVDEVIVRGTKKLKSFPAAPGIMPESVQNMLILDYGTEESLTIIRERAHEFAAVLVEPVQSRRPEFRPIEFLKQVRAITEESGTALIFDEVITGFRMHPGGAQALFGVKADLASYGKVIGGGLPIGVIAGKRDFMDALDGGTWQYGDGSFPEKGVTYFAGTFVRHPLVLAAAKASLSHLKTMGADLQNSLTHKAERIANALNVEFERHQIPLFAAQFGSLWKIKPKEEIPYSELLFTLMREKGVHIWDGFPCFTTEAHTDNEIDLVINNFIHSIDEMIDAGFFQSHLPQHTVPKEKMNATYSFNEPPVSGAKLGRDREGNPAWFVVDPEQPGKYLQFKL